MIEQIFKTKKGHKECAQEWSYITCPNQSAFRAKMDSIYVLLKRMDIRKHGSLKICQIQRTTLSISVITTKLQTLHRTTMYLH